MSIVLVHGAYGAPRDWAAVSASMVTRGPSVAVTLPGHGVDVVVANDAVVTEPGWHDAVAMVAAQLPAHGLIDLVGYSMGARVCLGLTALVAVRRRLRSLTLISGTAGIDDEIARDQRAAVDDDRAAQLARDPDAFLSAFWGLPLFSSLRQHPDRDRFLVDRQARARRHPDVLARWMRALSVGRQPSYWPMLTDLTVPCAVIVSAIDTEGVDVGTRMARQLPRAVLTVVPEVGHAALIEASAAVAVAIDTVIARAEIDAARHSSCAP